MILAGLAAAHDLHTESRKAESSIDPSRKPSKRAANSPDIRYRRSPPAPLAALNAPPRSLNSRNFDATGRT
jgi:hypothetical protein